MSMVIYYFLLLLLFCSLSFFFFLMLFGPAITWKSEGQGKVVSEFHQQSPKQGHMEVRGRDVGAQAYQPGRPVGTK